MCTFNTINTLNNNIIYTFNTMCTSRVKLNHFWRICLAGFYKSSMFKLLFNLSKNNKKILRKYCKLTIISILCVVFHDFYHQF